VVGPYLFVVNILQIAVLDRSYFIEQVSIYQFRH